MKKAPTFDSIVKFVMLKLGLLHYHIALHFLLESKEEVSLVFIDFKRLAGLKDCYPIAQLQLLNLIPECLSLIL